MFFYMIQGSIEFYQISNLHIFKDSFIAIQRTGHPFKLVFSFTVICYHHNQSQNVFISQERNSITTQSFRFPLFTPKIQLFPCFFISIDFQVLKFKTFPPIDNYISLTNIYSWPPPLATQSCGFTMYFLLLGDQLFQIPHMSEIMCYLSFCTQLISFAIMFPRLIPVIYISKCISCRMLFRNWIQEQKKNCDVFQENN